jgi:hypothetical protein
MYGMACLPMSVTECGKVCRNGFYLLTTRSVFSFTVDQASSLGSAVKLSRFFQFYSFMQFYRLVVKLITAGGAVGVRGAET